jgi:hypothetical protein
MVATSTTYKFDVRPSAPDCVAAVENKFVFKVDSLAPKYPIIG